MDSERLRMGQARLNTLQASAAAVVVAIIISRQFAKDPIWYSATFGSALICCVAVTGAAVTAAGLLAKDSSRIESPNWAPSCVFGCLGLLALAPFFLVFDASAPYGVERATITLATTFYGTFSVITLSVALILATEQRKDAPGHSPELAERLCFGSITFVLGIIFITWMLFNFTLEGL